MIIFINQSSYLKGAGGLGEKPDVEMLSQVAKLKTTFKAHVNAMRTLGNVAFMKDVEEGKTR